MPPSRIPPPLALAALTLLALGATVAPAGATGGAGASASLTAGWDGQSFTYRAGAGQTNDLQIMDMPGSPDVRRIAFNDVVPIRAGGPCTQPDPNDNTRVVCELPVSGESAPGTVRVLLGAGDDTFFSDAPGVTFVDGGRGNDELHAHSAYLVLGGSGDDMVMGRVVLHGGSGMDHLMGDYRDQYLWGGAGDDHISGYGGDDFASGDSGNDHVEGGEGDDTLLGGSGDDMLMGGPGTDRLWGGFGTDEIMQ